MQLQYLNSASVVIKSNNIKVLCDPWLKDGAYYSIKDADSDFTLVPFSTGSIISCDSDGNYFKVDMNSFQVDRVYKFIFKVISGSGTSEGFTNLYDDNYTFRVTK